MSVENSLKICLWEHFSDQSVGTFFQLDSSDLFINLWNGAPIYLWRTVLKSAYGNTFRINLLGFSFNLSVGNTFQCVRVAILSLFVFKSALLICQRETLVMYIGGKSSTNFSARNALHVRVWRMFPIYLYSNLFVYNAISICPWRTLLNLSLCVFH